jgi:hypothetical protein
MARKVAKPKKAKKMQVKAADSKGKKRSRSLPVIARHRPDDADDDDDLNQRILEEGKEVVYQDWDSGGPGGRAGRESIYCYGQKFYHFHDAGMEGPYESLTSAVKASAIEEVNSATVTIWRVDKGFTFER